mmetsp:Transcript_29030/g.93619  ORF Transcript_29030/g.93619 Transcript_29030/m.93619 type:complete len:231 (-) Transcript_29030:113-805(-)
MFSMPCWVSLLECVLDGALPSAAETFRLVAGFGGTVLVCAFANDTSRGGGESASSDRVIGFAGALVFATFNAGACVVTSRKLKRASPAAVCASQAMVALALASVSVVANHDAAERSFAALRRGRAPFWLFLVEVVSFPVSLFLRTKALLKTRNVHVVALLYAEIPLVLLWERLFLGRSANRVQVAGVAVIILGVLVANRRATATAKRGGNTRGAAGKTYCTPRSGPIASR